jgi:DNA-directed RNA polymerase beta subunit
MPSRECGSFHTLAIQKNSIELPEEQNAALQNLVRPHIESFDYFLNEGLRLALAHIEPREFSDTNGNRIEYWLEEVQIGKPLRGDKDYLSANRFIYPVEVRECLSREGNGRLKDSRFSPDF